MDENEMSWITVTRPRRSYLPPEEEEKAKKIMTEADLDRYKKHLDDSEYSFFFIKHAREGVARYDFFNPATEADALLTRDRIAGVASKTAVPLVGGQSHLLRQIAFVPNVVSFADDRARMWARTVSAQLFQYMRSKLLR